MNLPPYCLILGFQDSHALEKHQISKVFSSSSFFTQELYTVLLPPELWWEVNSNTGVGGWMGEDHDQRKKSFLAVLVNY